MLLVVSNVVEAGLLSGSDVGVIEEVGAGGLDGGIFATVDKADRVENDVSASVSESVFEAKVSVEIILEAKPVVAKAVSESTVVVSGLKVEESFKEDNEAALEESVEDKGSEVVEETMDSLEVVNISLEVSGKEAVENVESSLEVSGKEELKDRLFASVNRLVVVG